MSDKDTIPDKREFKALSELLKCTLTIFELDIDDLHNLKEFVRFKNGEHEIRLWKRRILGIPIYTLIKLKEKSTRAQISNGECIGDKTSMFLGRSLHGVAPNQSVRSEWKRKNGVSWSLPWTASVEEMGGKCDNVNRIRQMMGYSVESTNDIERDASTMDMEIDNKILVELVRGEGNGIDKGWRLLVDGVCSETVPQEPTKEGNIPFCVLPPPFNWDEKEELDKSTKVRPVVFGVRVEKGAIRPKKVELIVKEHITTDERHDHQINDKMIIKELRRIRLDISTSRDLCRKGTVLAYPFRSPSQSCLGMVGVNVHDKRHSVHSVEEKVNNIIRNEMISKKKQSIEAKKQWDKDQKDRHNRSKISGPLYVRKAFPSHEHTLSLAEYEAKESKENLPPKGSQVKTCMLFGGDGGSAAGAITRALIDISAALERTMQHMQYSKGDASAHLGRTMAVARHILIQYNNTVACCFFDALLFGIPINRNKKKKETNPDTAPKETEEQETITPDELRNMIDASASAYKKAGEGGLPTFIFDGLLRDTLERTTCGIVYELAITEHDNSKRSINITPTFQFGLEAHMVYSGLIGEVIDMVNTALHCIRTCIS